MTRSRRFAIGVLRSKKYYYKHVLLRDTRIANARERQPS